MARRAHQQARVEGRQTARSTAQSKAPTRETPAGMRPGDTLAEEEYDEEAETEEEVALYEQPPPTPDRPRGHYIPLGTTKARVTLPSWKCVIRCSSKVELITAEGQFLLCGQPAQDEHS